MAATAAAASLDRPPKSPLVAPRAAAAMVVPTMTAPVPPQLQASSPTSERLRAVFVKGPWAWALLGLIAPFLFFLQLSLSRSGLGAGSSYNTYVSIQVTNDGSTLGALTKTMPGAEGKSDPGLEGGAAGGCEYLSGRIPSIALMDSPQYRMCDMRSPSGDYTRGTWQRVCQGTDASTYIGSQAEYAGYSRRWEPTARWKACYGPDAKSGVVTLKTEGLMYNYQPTDCDLLSFNSMLMAEMLRRNKVYFVGDSLTEQFVNSVRALSGAEVVFNKSYILVNHKTLTPLLPEDWQRCMAAEKARLAKYLGRKVSDAYTELEGLSKSPEYGAGACKDVSDKYIFCEAETGRAPDLTRMVAANLPPLPEDCPTDIYRYSDKRQPAFAQQYHRAAIYQEWPAHMRDADVLFIGTGHHWWKEEALAKSESPDDPHPSSFSLYDKMIENLFGFLRDHFHGRHIIFVPATLGHYDCEKVTEVGQKPPATPEGTDIDKYRWRKTVEAQLNLVKLAEKAGIGERFVLLNLTMSADRPDHHPGTDCLHWCEPGVPDVWVHLAYNLLVQLGYANGARLP